MNKNWLVIVAVLVLAVGGYLVLSRNNLSNSPTVAPSPTMTMQPTAVSTTEPSVQNQSQIEIKNFSFSPASTTVKVGTTIKWTNNDSAPHTITSDNGVFGSGTLDPGQTFSFAFKQTGSFPYHCSIHTYMQGKVTVTQ